MASQAAHRQGGQQPLTHQPRIHTRTNGHHPTHTFAAIGHAGISIHAKFTAVARQQSQSVQHIAEIEARCLHRQFQFPGARRPPLQGHCPQRLQAAQRTAFQAEGRIGQGLKTLHPGPAITPGQQRFALT